MIKNNFSKTIIFTLCLSANVASAQVVGGILCGIGAFCPPILPPSQIHGRLIIKDSPIGLSLPDYYQHNELLALSETIRHFLKIQIGHNLKWGRSKSGRFTGGDFTILRIGTRSDNFDNCFKYLSALRVSDFDSLTQKITVIAQENYTGAACAISGLDPRIINDQLYYEIEEKHINWK